jgi:hypothetical protein
MKLWRVLTLTIVLVWIGAPLADGLMTWLAPAVWAGVVALAPPAAAALALVLYFRWRSRLKSQIAGQSARDDEMAAAA